MTVSLNKLYKLFNYYKMKHVTVKCPHNQLGYNKIRDIQTETVRHIPKFNLKMTLMINEYEQQQRQLK